MRYLFVTTYPPTRCGIGAYASQSVEKIRNEGHFVDIMSPDNKGEVDFKYCLQGGFKLLRVLKLGLFYDRIVIQYHPAFFFKEYENFRNKLANFATHISFIILFFIIRKIDIVCHEIYYYSSSHIGLENYFAHKIMWFMAPRIIFHTQKEVESFKKNMFSMFSRKKIILQKHNKDFHIYKDTTMEEARNELGLPLDINIFLCIGFIQKHKGFDRAIKAFNSINPPNSKLYIVGSLRLIYDETLNYTRLLRYLASQNPNVVLVEQFVSDQQFDTWISACDYVVVPYRKIWSSGVVGRAKLFGKEIIAADTGGLSDQIDGQDLLFTNDAELEVLIRMLSEPTIGNDADAPSLIAKGNDQNTLILCARSQGSNP